MLGALGQAGTKGPDSRCFVKMELAGLADRLNEGVKKRDCHIQMRKPDHRGLRNLLWTLRQSASAGWYAMYSHRACLTVGTPRGRGCPFLVPSWLPCLSMRARVLLPDLIKDRSLAHK